MNRARQLLFWPTALPVVLTACVLAGGALVLGAQEPNPNSAINPFFGSVTVLPASGDTLQLSLDQAIERGLQSNLGLKEAENSEKSVWGEKNQALQEFLPTITLTGDVGVHQQNLTALGFGPSALKHFTLPPGFSTITRDDLTDGQIHFDQKLFSGPVFSAWKAAGAAEQVAHYARMSARGEVIQQVATAYLRAIAAESEIEDATAQLAADQVQLSQAEARHTAGTAPHLDVLRAQVQLQARQQTLLNAQNSREKVLILLKREIGIDPGQKIALTDPAPDSDLVTKTPAEMLAIAYRSRQDYQNLQNQVIEDKAIHAAYRSQRWPSLSFSGYYGVSQVNDAGTHGNFLAQGTLSLPLFREARLRGDTDAAQANLDAANAQLADLRTHIDEQVRAALLDVQADAQLVQVARSNVDLATRSLADETDRVQAGVDDNLPLVDAQATLASAQNSLVESLYQYNLAKLSLARAAGVLETQFRAYLGR